MHERILPITLEICPSPRLFPVEKNSSKIEQKILQFQPLYEDICREIYSKFKPFPKDIFSKIEKNSPELNQLTNVVRIADEFRRSGGDMGAFAILKQLRDVGTDTKSFFLVNDIVCANIYRDEHHFSNYSINDLKQSNFGSENIDEVLINLGVQNGPKSFEAKQLDFITLSSNLLHNPYFNHEKMI